MSLVRQFTMLAIAVLAVVGNRSPVAADSCRISHMESAKSANGRYSVVARLADRPNSWALTGQWVYTWRDAKTNESHSGEITGIEPHAHPHVLVSNDGKRFVIADMITGFRFQDRILIYEPSGTLIRSLGISDILFLHERDDISRSMSHIQWYTYDHGRDAPIWINEDDAYLSLTTKTSSPVLISLEDGRVTRQPWTLQLVRYARSICFGSVLFLLFACQFLVHKRSHLRLSLTLSAAAIALLGFCFCRIWHNHFVTYGQYTVWLWLQNAIFAVGSLILSWACFWRSDWAAGLLTTATGILAIFVTVTLASGSELDVLHQRAWGFLAGSLILFGTLTWRGYRLCRFTPKSKFNATFVAPAPPAQIKRAQIKTIHLLIAMGFISLCMAVVRLSPSFRSEPHAVFDHTLQGALMSCFTVGLTWTFLTASRAALIRCGVIVLAIATALHFAPGALHNRGLDNLYWTGLAICMAFLAGLLLIVRLYGYRLTNDARKPPESAAEASRLPVTA